MVNGAWGLGTCRVGLPQLEPLVPAPGPGQPLESRDHASDQAGCHRREVATKASSSGFKKVLKPIQLSFIRCSRMFPLQRLEMGG